MKIVSTAFVIFMLSVVLAHTEDLVIKNSGERIRCTIEKEDSLSLHIVINKRGRSPRQLIIQKSEIKSFERDYNSESDISTPEVQSDDVQNVPNFRPSGSRRVEKPNAIATVGVLQGSSFIGADFEFAAGDIVGLQIGAGFIGWDVAMNFHFKETLRSSFFSVQLWNIGIGDNSTGVLSGGFVYRAREWFTCQLGLGVPLWSNSTNIDSPVILTYSIGAYFPI